MDTPPSLLLLGFPRSLTSLLYRATAAALPQLQTTCEPQGEVLVYPTRLYPDHRLPADSGRHAAPDAPMFQHILTLYRGGWLIKDVHNLRAGLHYVQRWPRYWRALLIQRPLADVLFRLWRKRWADYLLELGTHHLELVLHAQTHQEDEDLWRHQIVPLLADALLDVDAAVFPSHPHRVDFDEVLTDPRRLWAELERLGYRLAPEEERLDWTTSAAFTNGLQDRAAYRSDPDHAWCADQLLRALSRRPNR